MQILNNKCREAMVPGLIWSDSEGMFYAWKEFKYKIAGVFINYKLVEYWADGVWKIFTIKYALANDGIDNKIIHLSWANSRQRRQVLSVKKQLENLLSRELHCDECVHLNNRILKGVCGETFSGM